MIYKVTIQLLVKADEEDSAVGLGNCLLQEGLQCLSNEDRSKIKMSYVEQKAKELE